MKRIIGFVREVWMLKIAAFRLRLAIWLSDLRQKAYNKRFFVVLIVVGMKKGKEITRLRSISNTEFKYCKRKGWLPKKMSYLELEQNALYQTDVKRNNKESFEAREKARKKYLRYYKLVSR